MNRLRAIVATCVLLASSLPPAFGALPPARVGQRWALIVSTGGTARPSALALQRLLVDKYGFGSDAVVLLNGDATVERIQEAMNRLQARVKDFDAVFVYLSLDQRPEPSGGSFSFLPDGAGEAWTLLPARRVFEWLSALPIGSGLVIYPSCPSKFDEYLIGELGYGKRPGSLELLRVCQRGTANQAPSERRTSEAWRAHLMSKAVGVLQQAAAARAPLPAKELAGKLQDSVPGAVIDLRRVPEYIREGFVFEPAARGVAGEQTRYGSATGHGEREAALRNIPGIVKTATDPARESQLAARFLGEVAIDSAAGVRAPLEPSAVLSLRLAAVEALGEMRNDPARDALGAVIQKANDAPFIRRSALTQISRLMPPRAGDLAIVKAAFTDPDPSVRETAVRTAVVLNDKTAIATLAARLPTETEPTVRVAVIQALAALGSEDRANLVALLRDPDVAIRREAVTALGRLGPNAGATSALVDRLRTDPSADVRRQAAYSLGRIQPETRTEDPAVTSALLDALRAGPGAVREAVAYALGRTGGPGAEDALRALLRGGETEAERVAAAEALGALKSEGALEDLATALRTAESPGVRRAAAAALGALGRPEAVGPLAAALDDRDPYVQRQAQQSLEQSPVSRESLARGLLNKSSRVRLTAVRQAGKANDPGLVRPLIGALADADTDVRQAAIAALGAYRDPASLDLLARAARSESAEPADNRLMQFGALSVLATIPDLKAFKVVLALAQESSDPTLRVEALGALGTQLQWLRKAAGSTAVPDPEMKKALNDAAIVSLVAAKHDSVAVRRAATGALAAFPEGQKRLQEMAKLDQSPEVRSAAIERLNRAATRKE